MESNQLVPPPPPLAKLSQSSSTEGEKDNDNNEPWGELEFINRKNHPNIPSRILLRKDKIEVGRHLKNSAVVDIRLHTNNLRRFISRKHAVFRRSIISPSKTPRYDLIDQKSMCCTYVNGNKCQPVYQNLQTGDEIRFGGGNRMNMNDRKVAPSKTIQQDSLLFRFKILEDKVTGKKRKRNQKKKKKKTKKKKKIQNRNIKKMFSKRSSLSHQVIKKTISPSSSIDSQSTPLFRTSNNIEYLQEEEEEEEEEEIKEPFEKKRKLNDDDDDDDDTNILTIQKRKEELERNYQQKIVALGESYAEQQKQEFAKLEADELRSEENTLFSKEIISTLRCGLCNHFIRNSMMLPCSHNFCKRCLIDHIITRKNTTTKKEEQKEEEEQQKTCPSCNHLILAKPIRNRTLDALVESFVPYMNGQDQYEYTNREELMNTRDNETINNFNDLVKKKKNQGRTFFSIKDKWNQKKKNAVLTHLSTKFKSGAPRSRYFELIGFTKGFIQKASFKSLRLASENLKIDVSRKKQQQQQTQIGKKRCSDCFKKLKKDQKIKNLRNVLQKFHDSEYYFGL